MKLFFLFTCALCALSCSQQQLESSTDTTSVVRIDTVYTENTDHAVADSEYEDFDYKLNDKSKFKKNQIQEGIYYVFDPNGTKLETSEGVLQLAPGSKVIVTSEFDKLVTDETTNAVGYLYEITDANGRTGTLSSASLISLPYPIKKYNSLEEYALNQLHQIDSTRCVGRRHRAEPNAGHEGENEQMNYVFENGITLTTDNGYESATEFMSIPGITVQQGFYFLDRLGIVDLFEIFDGKIPNREMENAALEYGDEYIEVDVKINSDSSLAHLSINSSGGGCGCSYSITNQFDFIQIEVACGC